jgi:hypothetical protein
MYSACTKRERMREMENEEFGRKLKGDRLFGVPKRG